MTTLVFLTSASTSPWTVPAGVTGIQVDCIGPGQNGFSAPGDGSGGGGGFGGCFARKNTLPVTPGSTINFHVGAGGSGDDTWFQNTSVVLARSGDYVYTHGPSGGYGVGDVTYTGGAAAAGDSGGNGGSAGGAAGPHGAGGDGDSLGFGQGGTGDAGFGGVGGNFAPGGNGTEYDSTHGSGGGAGSGSYAGGYYGGGGGGGAAGNPSGGSGQDGLIVISYSPVTSGAGSSSGVGAASAAAKLIKAAKGTAAGAANVTATGRATSAGVAATSGSAVASAASIYSASSPGSAAGTGAVTGVGTAVYPGSGSASGAGAVSGIGKATDAANGASSGAGSASGVGIGLNKASGVAAGAGAAAAVGAPTAAGIGVAVGQSTATGVFGAFGAGTGQATGAATTTATGYSVAASAGSSAGASDTEGAGFALIKSTAIGASTGAADATAIGASSAETVGTTAGSSDAEATGVGTGNMVGASAGAATALALAASTAAGTGTIAGLSVATAVAVSSAVATGSASGAGVANAGATGIAPAIGTGAGLAQASGFATAITAISGSTAGHGAAVAASASNAAAVGASTGAATTQATGARTIAGQGVGAAAGTSTATAPAISLATSVGDAAGAAQASGIGATTAAAQGVSAGAGDGAAASNAIIALAGSAAGATQVDGDGNAFVVIFSVGDAEGAASAGAVSVSQATGAGSAVGAAVVVGAGGYAPKPSGKSVEESLDSQSQLSSALKAGLGTISQNQTVQFVKYVKVVLPLDGFVFWVKSDLLSPAALGAVSTYNSFAFNQPRRVIGSDPNLVAQGSLHITTSNQQDADESFSVNKMVFTSETPVNDLNEISPMVMYLARHGDYKFAFSQRQSFYKQAGLYHYVGDAVYPVMESQIIDDLNGFDTRNLVVSNSLPIWLGLNQIMPVFPSFLVPDNIRPPYASVYIDPDGTQAIQSAPFIDQQSNHWQLVRDRVRFTVYGLRNFNALDFQDYLLEQSLLTDNFGVMNMPVMRDEHRTQTELSTLAQKKSMIVDASYYQNRMRDIARQLILCAIPTFCIADGPQVRFRTPTRSWTAMLNCACSCQGVEFGENLALPYSGPFDDAEVLPQIVFLQTTTLTRGVAFTSTPAGSGVFSFYRGDRLAITVTVTEGENYPQIQFVDGPETFYINQVLTPVAPTPPIPGLTDLTITLGTDPG